MPVAPARPGPIGLRPIRHVRPNPNYQWLLSLVTAMGIVAAMATPSASAGINPNQAGHEAAVQRLKIAAGYLLRDQQAGDTREGQMHEAQATALELAAAALRAFPGAELPTPRQLVDEVVAGVEAAEHDRRERHIDSILDEVHAKLSERGVIETVWQVHDAAAARLAELPVEELPAPDELVAQILAAAEAPTPEWEELVRAHLRARFLEIGAALTDFHIDEFVDVAAGVRHAPEADRDAAVDRLRRLQDARWQTWERANAKLLTGERPPPTVEGLLAELSGVPDPVEAEQDTHSQSENPSAEVTKQMLRAFTYRQAQRNPDTWDPADRWPVSDPSRVEELLRLREWLENRTLVVDPLDDFDVEETWEVEDDPDPSTPHQQRVWQYRLQLSAEAAARAGESRPSPDLRPGRAQTQSPADRLFGSEEAERDALRSMVLDDLHERVWRLHEAEGLIEADPQLVQAQWEAYDVVAAALDGQPGTLPGDDELFARVLALAEPAGAHSPEVAALRAEVIELMIAEHDQDLASPDGEDESEARFRRDWEALPIVTEVLDEWAAAGRALPPADLALVTVSALSQNDAEGSEDGPPSVLARDVLRLLDVVRKHGAESERREASGLDPRAAEGTDDDVMMTYPQLLERIAANSVEDVLAPAADPVGEPADEEDPAASSEPETAERPDGTATSASTLVESPGAMLGQRPASELGGLGGPGTAGCGSGAPGPLGATNLSSICGLDLWSGSGGAAELCPTAPVDPGLGCRSSAIDAASTPGTGAPPASPTQPVSPGEPAREPIQRLYPTMKPDDLDDPDAPENLPRPAPAPPAPPTADDGMTETDRYVVEHGPEWGLPALATPQPATTYGAPSTLIGDRPVWPGSGRPAAPDDEDLKGAANVGGLLINYGTKKTEQRTG